MLKPIVKWAGGKTRLYKELIEFIPDNFNNYHEPFLGGGATLFNLANEDLLEKEIYINDINEDLINLYLVVRDNLEELLELTRQTRIDNKTYLEIRSWDRDPNYDKLDPIKKAFRFIYLNKTCFNGLYRHNSSGKFNVPFGNYKKVTILDITYIYAIRDFLKKCTITNVNFMDTLKNVKENDLVYLDPPYHPISTTSSFTSYWKDNFKEKEQHLVKEYFEEAKKIKAHVILSNSYCPFIQELYKDYNQHEVTIFRLIGSKSTSRVEIKELIIT